MSNFRGGRAITRGQTMRAARDTLWTNLARDSSSIVVEEGGLGGWVVGVDILLDERKMSICAAGTV